MHEDLPNNPGVVHHYTAEILSVQEQYAFGMNMPGRSFSVEEYRYGMNGQEKSDEIFKGVLTAEFWEYDSRIGRRWNMDPVVKPWESRYATFYNNPFFYADPHGLDGEDRAKAYAKKTGGDVVNVGKGKWEVKTGKGIDIDDPFSAKGKSRGVKIEVAKFEDNIFDKIGKGVISGLRKLETLQVRSMGSTYGEGEHWVEGGEWVLKEKLELINTILV
jgi:hypothetical protein